MKMKKIKEINFHLLAKSPRSEANFIFVKLILPVRNKHKIYMFEELDFHILIYFESV